MPLSRRIPTLPGCVGVFVFSLAFAGRAGADESKDACLAAASSGQTLRDQHKLVQARDAFRACARRECPAVVQSDCSEWLDAVEKNLPTVVFSAKDVAGADVIDVIVSVDGERVVAVRDGQSLPIDPGPHVFHFAAGGTSVDAQVVVRAGVQNQPVSVVFGLAALSSGPQPPPPPPRSADGQAEAPRTPSRTWKTVGWALGGAGVVGLGVGSVAGVLAVTNKNSANCDANQLCDPGSLASARTAARVADVGLIAGGLLLAAGGALLLFTPSATPTATRALHLRVAPAIGRATGATLEGSF